MRARTLARGRGMGGPGRKELGLGIAAAQCPVGAKGAKEVVAHGPSSKAHNEDVTLASEECDKVRELLRHSGDGEARAEEF